MTGASLRLAEPADADDLAGYLRRVGRLDPSALLRLKGAGDRLGIFSRLPMGVLGLRTLLLPAATDVDLVASAVELLHVIEAAAPFAGEPLLVVPEQPPTAWTGHLPARSGWERVGSARVGQVAAAVQRRVDGWRLEAASTLDRSAAALDALARQHWDAPVDVGEATGAGVRFGALHALDRLGFLGASDDRVLVSRAGGWLRLEAEFGAVLQPPSAPGVVQLG